MNNQKKIVSVLGIIGIFLLTLSFANQQVEAKLEVGIEGGGSERPWKKTCAVNGEISGYATGCSSGSGNCNRSSCW